MDVEEEIKQPKSSTTTSNNSTTPTTSRNSNIVGGDHLVVEEVDPEVGQVVVPVSIQDVANTVPTESKEETDVLRSLENRTNTQSNHRSSSKSILAEGILDGLPEEASHIFSTATATHKTSANTLIAESIVENPPSSILKQTSGRSTKTKRSVFNTERAPGNIPVTVEDELHDLVNELNDDDDDNDPNLNSSSIKLPGGGGGTGGNQGVSFNNKFTNDANKVIKKASKISGGKAFKDSAKDTMNDFKQYLMFQKESIGSYCWKVMLLIIIATGIAALLFYALGNPGGSFEEPVSASTSWWFLFLFVRQVITWTMAKATEALVIDFCCLRHPIFVRLLGPYLALFLIQSKGWPYHLTMFSIYDFALLYGNRDLARHWLYWQNVIKLFSKSNPPGKVTEDPMYGSVLTVFLISGILAALKRYFMGLWYGQAVYQKYGLQLSTIMKKSLLLKNLAKYSKHSMVEQTSVIDGSFKLDVMTQLGVVSFDDGDDDNKNDDEEDTSSDTTEVDDDDVLIKMGRKDVFASTSFNQSHRQQIQNLLGEWEEPSLDDRSIEIGGIGAIVQFRTAVSSIDKDFPFSPYFGLASKREHCIESAQKLYLRLKGKDADVLTFDKIAVVALNEENELNQAMIRDLIKLFRPTREGELNMLDFLKSIDTVYKDLRLLQASIMNMQRMNVAFQRVWDYIFWFFIAWMFLVAIGVDAIALIGSLTAIIVGLAFMIGNALSKSFEGLLFVLARKPYDVGDRIAVAGIDKDAPGGGSAGWIVKDMNLYTSTLVYGTTGEEATFTNGYLNSYRVINMNRSPKATLSFVSRFGIDVSKEKIETFGQKVESYVKARPREWLSFGAYRLTDVAPDLGYVEYKVILQHRESWQQIGALLASRADVQGFAFELSKELGMDYESPPLPIILGDRNLSDMVGASLTKKEA